MKAKCPHCKNKWSVSRKYAGATLECPACRKPVGLASSAPIGALMLTALISTGLAVAVNSWMLSNQTDVGKVNAATAEVQTKINAVTAKLENFNTEFARIQTQLARTAAQPIVAMADTYSQAQIVPGRMKNVSSEPADQNDLSLPQKSDSKLDDVASLLVFEGTINRSLGPLLVLVSSAKKVNQLTYSNFKYVPPFVLDESAVIELAAGAALPENIKGAKLSVYVVADGRYEYKETIGAIEIPKVVNKYRETNIEDPPKQVLVEFRPEQPMQRGPRRMPQPKSRSDVRRERLQEQAQQRQAQQRQRPR